MKFLKGRGKLVFFFLIQKTNVEMFVYEKNHFRVCNQKNIEFTLGSRETKVSLY